MTDVRLDAEEVRAACSLAECAPSLLGGPPWRWYHDGGSLELWLDTSLALPETDPAGRELVISCGAALHHAALSLRAHGRRIEVDRLPAEDNSALLGRIRLLGARDPVPADRALARAARRRHLEQRRCASVPVAPGLLIDVESLSDAADVSVVTDDQRPVLARAFTTMVREASGSHRAESAGCDHTAEESAPRNGRQRAEFAETGSEDSAGTLLLISTDTDEREAHLRAGEALGAVLCWAELAGMAAWPLGEAFEVPRARAEVRREVLGNTAHPQVAVRVGWPAAIGCPEGLISER